MSRYLTLVMGVIIALVVAGFAFSYATGRIELGTFIFLGCVSVALGVVVLVFLGRMMDPAESLEQTLYKADHPSER